MLEGIGEAIGAILGLLFGGWLLLRLASELQSTGPFDVWLWGALFILAAVVAAILLVVGVVVSAGRQL